MNELAGLFGVTTKTGSNKIPLAHQRFAPDIRGATSLERGHIARCPRIGGDRRHGTSACIFRARSGLQPRAHFATGHTR